MANLLLMASGIQRQIQIIPQLCVKTFTLLRGIALTLFLFGVGAVLAMLIQKKGEPDGFLNSWLNK